MLDYRPSESQNRARAMAILRHLLWLLFPAAFVIGVGDILYYQAKSRGRSVFGWVTFGCGLTILGAVLGFEAAPFVVEMSGLIGDKAVRLFFIATWIPAVVAAALVGIWLALLGPVAKKGKSFLGAAVTMKAEEWHTHESCKACGFLFEVGDLMCQCPACTGYSHVRCWNENEGCSVCPRSDVKADTGGMKPSE